MKKTTIIFIIVICILFFVEIPCLATKEASSPSGMWNSMDDNAKETYIWGIRESLAMITQQITERILFPSLINKDDTSIIEDIIKYFYQFIGMFKNEYNFEKTNALLKTIVNVISDLYKDPANTYIEVTDMCILASRKLRGEPIESLLRELRKDALP